MPPSQPREGRGEGEGTRKKKEPAKQERRQSLGRKGGKGESREGFPGPSCPTSRFRRCHECTAQVPLPKGRTLTPHPRSMERHPTEAKV